MRVDLFDFELPDDLIALRPATPRDAARLLVVPADGGTRDRGIGDLPALLRCGDALVLNDTRVIPARLYGKRVRGETSARIEVLLHRRLAADRWLALARPAKRLAAGDRVAFGAAAEGVVCALDRLDATVEERGEKGDVCLRFDLAGPALDEAVGRHGEMPLPPYIAGRRATDAADLVDYQTVYATVPGAVAAPTAGLHLTDALLHRFGEGGIECHRLTLHVGAGTFLPVSAKVTADHRMHPEAGVLDEPTADALNRVRAQGGRIVAVGTTALRLLESATDPDGIVRPFRGETDIFITPGYRFRAVDLLLTNFHLPRSTLFMLVSAFAGLDRMQAAYAQAIASGYRFYSYGDACLLERADTL